MNTIEIWAPKFSTQQILIAPYHVQPGLNRIVFTKTWRDKVLLMDAAKIKSYPMQSNGSIGVYAIPIKDFEIEPTGQTDLFEETA